MIAHARLDSLIIVSKRDRISNNPYKKVGLGRYLKSVVVYFSLAKWVISKSYLKLSEYKILRSREAFLLVLSFLMPSQLFFSAGT